MEFEEKQIETRILAQLQNELGMTIGINENLIQMGLNSIAVMKILAFWSKEGYDIRYSALFHQPTVAEWTKIIYAGKAAVRQEGSFCKEVDMYQPFPLTDVQYAYWIGRKKENFLGDVGCHGYFEVDVENLDRKKLSQSWQILFDYHPMLRAKFLETGMQVIMETAPQAIIEWLDLTATSKEEKKVRMENFRKERSHRLLNINDGQVIHLTVVQLDAVKSRLFFEIDLLVCDVQSFQIIMRDFSCYYSRKALPPVEKEWNFAMYLAKQRHQSKRNYKRDELFWKTMASHLPEGPTLPILNENLWQEKRRFSRLSHFLTKSEKQKLVDKSREMGVTLASIFLTAYSYVISHWSENKQFLMNVPLFNRDPSQSIANVVADFTNVVLVPVDFTKKHSFFEYVKAVQSSFQQSIDHSMYSGIKVIRDIKKIKPEFTSPYVVFSCNLGNPLFPTEFIETFGQIHYMISQTPQALLDFQLFDEEEGLRIIWDVVADAFPEGVVGEMFDFMLQVLKTVMQEKISEDSFEVLSLSQKKHKNRVREFKDTASQGKTMVEQIIANAAIQGNRIALLHADTQEETTYEELVKSSQRLAGYLKKRGVKKGSRLVILTERNKESIMAMLAVHYIGCAYIPIQSSQPLERLNLILDSAGVQTVLAFANKIRQINSQVKGEVIYLNIEEGLQFTETFQKVEALPSDTAYLIFTSGSTGIPKGVEITHESAMNTIDTINQQYHVTSKDRGITLSSFDFDLAVYDIYGLLNAGGSLVLIPKNSQRNAEVWLEAINQFQVTVWNSVPTLMKMLWIKTGYGKVSTDSLRLILLSGDWVPLDLPQKIRQLSENVDVVALGGATEASIWSNYFDIPKSVPKDWLSIPYGQPLRNQLYRVVDNLGEDCPDYVSGELRIGGKGVAQGYIGNQELSKKHFIEEFGIRWYVTGDFGRFWRDGTLEFLGRKDSQIKIQGHRVELGEVEAKLREQPEVKEGIVLFQSEENMQQLLAFYVANPSKNHLLKQVVLPSLKREYDFLKDLSFFTYCQEQRRGILKDLVEKIEKKCPQLSQKDVELVKGWKKESESIEIPEDLNVKKGKDPRLTNYLMPIIQQIPDLMNGSIQRSTLVQSPHFVSPQKLSEKMEAGKYVKELLVKLIVKLKDEHKNVNSRPLKIMEVGARSIETTICMLQALDEVEYTLVDNSRYYLNQAKQHVEKVKDIHYFSFDYEAEIAVPFEEEAFDVIIMNNTLHQVKNIPKEFEKFSNALHQNGFILIVENTVSFPLEDITTGLFKPNYEDQRQQTGEMILSHNEWQKIIQQSGNVLVETFPKNQEGYPLYVYMVQNSFCDRRTVNKKIEFDMKQKLPFYMLPDYYYAVPALPVTENGKIDRKKLLAHAQLKRTNNKKVRSMNETETILAKIWQNLLQTTITRQSNYFRLGGDSLLATQLSSEIQQQFGLSFSIELIFEKQTLEEMAEYIQEQQKKSNLIVVSDKIPFQQDLCQKHEPFPLTDVQHAYLLGQNEAFSFGGLSTQCYFELDCQNLDIERAEFVFNQLIKEHGMLRAHILEDDQHQKIEDKVPYYQIKATDIRFFHQDKKEHYLKEMRQRLSKIKYDRYTWPLYKIEYVQIEEEYSRIFLNFDNILIDGWSMFYILKEWAYLYQFPLEKPHSSQLNFRDYVIHYEELKKNGKHEEDWEYWLAKKDELYPAPDLPIQKQYSKEKSQFIRYQFRLPSQIWQKLKQKIQVNSITPAAFLLSSYAEVLQRWSQNEQFSLNVTNFKRLPVHQDINQLVGDFTSLTIHGVNMKSASHFLDRTTVIQKNLWQDLQHSFVSGIEIERFLNKNGSQGMMPIVFTCGLGLEQGLDRNYQGYLGKIHNGLSHTPQVWLDNQVSEEDGELLISWDVLEGIFPENMPKEMFTAYSDFLQSLAESDDLWVQVQGDIINVQNQEFCTRLNQTKGPVVQGTLIDHFQHAATTFSKYKAVEGTTYSFTYEKLDQLANEVAKKMLAQGIEEGQVVGIWMPKGWQQVVAILGILKCGGIYLPLKYDNPVERNIWILQQSNAKGLLVSFLGESDQTLCLKEGWVLTVEEKYETSSVNKKRKGEDIAYVIYTSGTTGEPKGVAISHRAALNTITAINRYLHISKEDKIISLSDISFDLSVYDIFGVLLVGGSIVIPDDKQAKEPSHWLELEKDFSITIWNSVPMYMRLYIEYRKSREIQQKSHIREILLSGDWIPLSIKKEIKNTIGNCGVSALGGATEAAIWSNLFKIEEVLPHWNSIPYGTPLPNQQYYVYDTQLRRRPNKVTGDLYIGGEGLAKGYWQDQKATKNNFIICPNTGERLYKTGDKGQYSPTEGILFCGREDNQIKLNGFRIDLEEINLVVEKIDDVVQAFSLVDKNGLITFVKLKREIDLSFIKKELRKKLPAYMQPRKIIEVKKIPLSANGKVDRKQLEQGYIETKIEMVEEDLTTIEREIKAIWEDVLALENISILENYLALGGDSLRAIQIGNKLSQKYHQEISLRDFYEHQTIKELATFLSRQGEEIDSGEI